MFPVCDGFQGSEADLAIAGPGSCFPAGHCWYLASPLQVPGSGTFLRVWPPAGM